MNDDLVIKKGTKIIKQQRDKAYLNHGLNYIQTGQKPLTPSEFTKEFIKKLSKKEAD